MAGLRAPPRLGLAEGVGADLPPDARAGSERALAFEVGLPDLDRLPRGKEADGIIGDFVLRNESIEALVSGNQPGRRANMTTNYGFPTAGCLYDLSTLGSANDQLTCLAPGGLEGRVSSVRVLSEGGDGSNPMAVVRVERTAALGEGLEEVHEYRLAPGWRHLLIASTYLNRTRRPLTLKPAAVWKGLSAEIAARRIRAADAMDPMDRQGYAIASPGWSGELTAETSVKLGPGESLSVNTAVAPGRSPAEAFGAVAALLGPTGTLRGRVYDPSGAGVPTATIEITVDGKTLPAYPDASGDFQVELPPGEYQVSCRDLGRPSVKTGTQVFAGRATELLLDMRNESRVSFDVTGPGEENTPVKVQFIGIAPTTDPDLGPTIRAHGCKNQYHSETGWFTVAVPPGEYRVVLTRGMEYDHHQREITVRPGRETRVAATLRRVVDTRGWVATDFHNHSTPSGDNYCGTDDRLINLAAEGVEFAPTTEHNRFYDWAPHLQRLGLSREISTVVGIELTGAGAHLNSFPLAVVPGAQGGGAPTWSRDPRVNAMTLRDWRGGSPDRWVQLNHPAVGEFFRDRNADGIADGGFTGLESLIDAAEFWSEDILSFSPTRRYKDRKTQKTRRIENRTFAWLQLLNQGRRVWCLAVSDAHEVFNNGVGGWRTYVPSSTDEPAQIDPREIIRNARAGRMVVTNGPYLEAGLVDGTLPGGTTVAAGSVQLHVRVQTTTWLDVDRVQVLVNGRARPELNFTSAGHPDLFRKVPGDSVRFDSVLDIPLTEDSWIIAVAYGERSNLAVGFGLSYQAEEHPCAYHNPIYVDVDGGGFRPNGDTLGHPLPVAFPVRRSF